MRVPLPGEFPPDSGELEQGLGARRLPRSLVLSHSGVRAPPCAGKSPSPATPPDGVTFKAILSDTPCCPPHSPCLFLLNVPQHPSRSLRNVTVFLFAEVHQTVSKSGVCPGASHLSVNPIIREPKVAQEGDVKTDLRACLQLTARLDVLADNTSLRVELFCNGWFTPQPPKSWQQLSAVENTS